MSRVSKVVLSVATISIFLVPELTCAQTWQQSTSAEVNMAVRDKHGQVGVYSVVFSVKDPSGKVFTRTVRAKDDEWSSVRFPTDFDTYSKPGRYSWKATIGGRTVADGKFIHESVSGGARVSVMH